MMRPFLIALQFLTAFPVRLNRAPEPRELGYSLLYYPLVGFLLGLLLAESAGLLAALPPLLTSSLLLTGWVILTGALHLDGLSDTSDAWAGGLGDRERTLAIMKDPCSGPIGVTSVVLVLLLKFAALFTICDAGEHSALLFIPWLARTALPLLFLSTPYVRAGGLGSFLAEQLPRKAAVAIVGISYAAIVLLGGKVGLVVFVSGLALFVCLRHLMKRRIGGMTGDTAGALVELTEVVTLVSAAIVVSLEQ